MSREHGFFRTLWEKVRIKFHASEKVTAEFGHWEPPDEAVAREKYRRTHAHHDVFHIRAPVKSLMEFGEGVQLYFYLLRNTAIVFALLALVPGLPLMVFNGLGGWYDKADLERTMLGNYGLLTHDGPGSSVNVSSSGAFSKRSAFTEGSVTALFASSVSGTPAHVKGMDKRDLLIAMSVLDLLGVVVFVCYSFYMIWMVRSRARIAARTAATTIADYAVRVTQLPPDTTAAALREYLTKEAGEGVEIVKVELCRRVARLLDLVVERGAAVPKKDLALAVLQRQAEVFPRVFEGRVVDVLFYRFLLEDLTEAIRQEQAATKTNEVVCAFVTFSLPEHRRRALQALPRSRLLQWRMNPERKFNNGGLGKSAKRPVALDISAPPEPSDVQYENLECDRVERFARIVLSNTGKYLVLLVGFLLVSLAPALRMGVAASGSGPERSECEASCTYRDAAGNFALSDEDRIAYKSCDPVAGTGALPNKLDCEAASVCYECFCRAALSSGGYGEVLYCLRFSSVVAVATVAQMCAVLGIVVANFLIELAIVWLVRREKHHTRSREVVGIVRGLFITQFINTAFSNLAANMYLPGPAKLISNSFLNGYIFSGAYSDTTPNWYHDVCRPIMISVFVTTIIVHLKVGFRWWLRRRRLARRYQCLTQEQLEEAYTGHQFELALKYGQHLYIIFVVLTYSAAMPLLYTLAALHFATCYWSEKFELLKLCKRPISYSRDVALYVSSTLPFAALWHLAAAIWLFSLFGMPLSPLFSHGFRQSLQSSVAAFEALMPIASNLTPQLVAWRFTQNSSGHLFIAFIACGGLLFIFFTLSTWLAATRWLLSLLGRARDLRADDDEDAERTAVLPEFEVAVRSQLLVGPSSYAVQQNPAYAHAFVRMEELEWEKQEELLAKAAADGLGPFMGGPTGLSPTSPQTPPSAAADHRPPTRDSRRKRTAANRLRAKQQAAKPGPWSAYDYNGAATMPYASPTGAAAKGNQVAPEPSPPAPPPPAAAGAAPQPELTRGPQTGTAAATAAPPVAATGAPAAPSAAAAAGAGNKRVDELGLDIAPELVPPNWQQLQLPGQQPPDLVATVAPAAAAAAAASGPSGPYQISPRDPLTGLPQPQPIPPSGAQPYPPQPSASGAPPGAPGDAGAGSQPGWGPAVAGVDPRAEAASRAQLHGQAGNADPLTGQPRAAAVGDLRAASRAQVLQPPAAAAMAAQPAQRRSSSTAVPAPERSTKSVVAAGDLGRPPLPPRSGSAAGPHGGWERQPAAAAVSAAGPPVRQLDGRTSSSPGAKPELSARSQPALGRRGGSGQGLPLQQPLDSHGSAPVQMQAGSAGAAQGATAAPPPPLAGPKRWALM